MSKSPPLPFRPQPFLFRMLLAVFLIECGFLAFAFWKCSEPLPENPVPLVNERCPRLGQRSQEIFQQAMAVTLSLLGGGALAGGFNRQPSSDGGASSVPGSSLPQLPPEGPQGPRSPASGRARKSQRPEPPEEG